MNLKGLPIIWFSYGIPVPSFRLGVYAASRNVQYPFVLSCVGGRMRLFHRHCSFQPSSMATSIFLALSSCDGTVMVHVGLGMAPKTRSVAQRTSGPTVQLAGRIADCMHSSSLVWRLLSAQIRSYANRKGAWYLSTTRLAPDGASFSLTPKASTVSFICVDV